MAFFAELDSSFKALFLQLKSITEPTFRYNLIVSYYLDVRVRIRLGFFLIFELAPSLLVLLRFSPKDLYLTLI